MSSLARRAEELVGEWPSDELVVGVLPAASDAEWSGRAALELSRAAADDRLTTWTLDLAPGASDLASRFGTDREPGFTRVAAGDAELSEVLHRDQWSGAHYLPGDVRILGTKSRGAKCIRALGERIPGREGALLVLMEPKAADVAASAGWLDGVVRLGREDDDVAGDHSALTEVPDLGRLARPVEGGVEEADEEQVEEEIEEEPAADAGAEPTKAAREGDTGHTGASPGADGASPGSAGASPGADSEAEVAGADGAAESPGRRVAEPAGEPDIVVDAEPAADPPVEAAWSDAGGGRSDDLDEDPSVLEVPADLWASRAASAPGGPAAAPEQPERERRSEDEDEDEEPDAGRPEPYCAPVEDVSAETPGASAPEPPSPAPSSGSAAGPFATRPFSEPDEPAPGEGPAAGGAGGEGGAWSWLLDRLPWKPWESSDGEETDEPDEIGEAEGPETAAEAAVGEEAPQPRLPVPAAATELEAVDRGTAGDPAPDDPAEDPVEDPVEDSAEDSIEDPAETAGADESAAPATGRELTVYRRPSVPARPAEAAEEPEEEPAAARALEAPPEAPRLPPAPAPAPEAPAESAPESPALPVPAARVEEPGSAEDAGRPAAAAGPEPEVQEEVEHAPAPQEGRAGAVRALAAGSVTSRREEAESAADAADDTRREVLEESAAVVEVPAERWRPRPPEPAPESGSDGAGADPAATSEEPDPAELISPGRWTAARETAQEAAEDSGKAADDGFGPELPAAPADPGRFTGSDGTATPEAGEERRTADAVPAVRAATWSAPEWWLEAPGGEPTDGDDRAASGASGLVHGGGVAGQWTVRPGEDGEETDAARAEPAREPEATEDPGGREEPKEPEAEEPGEAEVPETADFITFDRGMPSEWADGDEEPEDSGPADFISQDVGVPGQDLDRNRREAKRRSRTPSTSASSMSGSPREKRLEREGRESRDAGARTGPGSPGARRGAKRRTKRPDSRSSQFRRRGRGLPGRIGRWLVAATVAGAVALGAAAGVEGVGPGDIPGVAGKAAVGLTQGVATFIGDPGAAGDDADESADRAESAEPPPADAEEGEESSASSPPPGPVQTASSGRSGGGQRAASGGAVIPATADPSRPAAGAAGESAGDAAFGTLSDALAGRIERYYRTEERYRSGGADCSALMQARERTDSLYARLSLYRLAGEPGLSSAAESALEARNRQIESLNRSYDETGCPSSR